MQPVISPTGTVAMLCRIAGINAPVETKMWCTASLWGKFIGELNALGPAIFDSQNRPTPQNFREMRINTTLFINSGTDDQRVCNMRNDAEERKANFREKHDRMAIRAGEKKTIDYQDAAATHDIPDDLLKQVKHDARAVLPTGAVSVRRRGERKGFVG